MVRSPLCLLAALALGACDTPSPYFAGRPALRVTVEGSTFDVRRRGRLAEALRLDPALAPRLGPIGPRAAHAMAQATGCRVVRIAGDAAMIVGQLDCGAGPPPAVAMPAALDCVLHARQRGFDGTTTALELDCLPE